MQSNKNAHLKTPLRSWVGEARGGLKRIQFITVLQPLALVMAIVKYSCIDILDTKFSLLDNAVTTK